MPFGRYIVVFNHTFCHTIRWGPHGKGRLGGLNPPAKTCNFIFIIHQGAAPISDSAFYQINSVLIYVVRAPNPGLTSSGSETRILEQELRDVWIASCVLNYFRKLRFLQKQNVITINIVISIPLKSQFRVQSSLYTKTHAKNLDKP